MSKVSGKKRRKKDPKGKGLIAAVVLILCIVLAYNSREMNIRLEEYKENEARLQEQIDEQRIALLRTDGHCVPRQRGHPLRVGSSLHNCGSFTRLQGRHGRTSGQPRCGQQDAQRGASAPESRSSHPRARYSSSQSEPSLRSLTRMPAAVSPSRIRSEVGQSFAALACWRISSSISTSGVT